MLYFSLILFHFRPSMDGVSVGFSIFSETPLSMRVYSNNK